MHARHGALEEDLGREHFHRDTQEVERAEVFLAVEVVDHPLGGAIPVEDDD